MRMPGADPTPLTPACEAIRAAVAEREAQMHAQATTAGRARDLRPEVVPVATQSDGGA